MCFGKSSTKMGDLLGTPHVAPFSFASKFFCRAYRLRRSSTLALYAPLSFSSHFFLLGLLFTSFPHTRFVCMHLSGVEVHHRIQILFMDLTRLRWWVQSYQHQCTRSHQNSALRRVCARVVLGWVTSWEVLVLRPFILLRNFFAGLISYGGPACSVCMHPFLFLRIFFVGLVVYVIPTRSLCVHAPL